MIAQREQVRTVYDGFRGSILSLLSTLSLHVPLGRRLIGRRRFDVSQAKQILDVGTGAGQLLRHLLCYSDTVATLTGLDVSHTMLRRARRGLHSQRPQLLVAQLPALPFADETFDCITCGYVLEHLAEAQTGLAELARVLKPGGRMLLLTSEDTWAGLCTSWLFRCRTYRREELGSICRDLDLIWKELWFSPVHRVLQLGGICVELTKPP